MLKNENFNIFDIAEKNNYKRFIHFRVTLRDKIKYDIELIEGTINFTGDKKNHPKRNVVFACQTYFRNNQSVPPKYNNSFLTYKPISETYSYETSVIDILLECSDKDFKEMTDNLPENEKEKEIEIKLYELLEYFSYKYNLAVSGNDFIDTLELCVGSFKYSSYYRNKKTGKYESKIFLIMPSLSIFYRQKESELNLQKVVNNNIPAWKYFVNKTKYNYTVYNNIDCVINAAISIESYIIYLIKKENKYSEYIKKYKRKLGFKSAIDFCETNKIINKEIIEILNQGYEKIGKYRSLIIHGAIDSPIIDRKQAKKSYETIVDIFSSIDQKLYNKKELLIPSAYFETDYNNMKKILFDYKNGNFQSALDKLNDNIEKNIFKDLSIFNRGKCYIALKKSEEAIEDFNQCISNRYRLIESYNYLGMELIKINKYEEAKKVYLKVIKLDSSYSEFYYNLGIAQQLLKEYDDAIISYNSALSIEKCGAYYYNLGTVYYYKKDITNTILNYNQTIKLEPNNSKYLYERAFLYETLNQPTKAEKDIVKCYKYYKNDPHIALIKERIYQIGVLYQKSNKYKDAIRMFNKGVKIDKNSIVFYQARGNCYKAIKNLKKAKEDYIKAIELSPDSIINISNIIYYFIDINDFTSAEQYIKILIKKHNKSIKTAECLNYYDIKRFQNNIITYEELLNELKKRNVDIKKILEPSI